MKGKKTLILLFILAAFLLIEAGQDTVPPWPQSQPSQHGYLRVSELHEIFFQVAGTKDGKPVMFLHGGPGGGCSPADFRYFNPDKFLVVLHDQRGTGKSRPYGEWRENTTWDLVEDVEKLRLHLKLGKVILFGGSWGSTLALAYAEKYPQNVCGMILRGVFTSTKEELDHYYYGGTAKFFPEAHRDLLANVSDPTKKIPEQLAEILKGPDSETRKRTAAAWLRYEARIAMIEVSEETINHILEGYDPYPMAVLENHYMANRCFLKEGQLLNEAGTLRDIRTVIVNGRYDMICPPITAWRLHKRLPGSELHIIPRAGHSAWEPGIQSALLKAVRSFE